MQSLWGGRAIACPSRLPTLVHSRAHCLCQRAALHQPHRHMERYICIHGHFYQPPRENPWLEDIEFQESAYPYHDWNERITAECYQQNAASRILDAQNRIVQIVNNYSRISFNFGPTLLTWLEQKAPSVYHAILDADRESQNLFNGHGSAIAQAYNHMIMPLANHCDKITQVIWGIRDFEHRFKRPPEGMWLPETAVDLESLEILAAHGITYTILAPYQARAIRKLGDKVWDDVSGGRIDPTRAYVLNLPSGRSINLFFYDGPVSRAVAFERLLSNGEHFAHRIASTFNDRRSWPQLAHIATDGETYGHHHRHGDMALAYALRYIEASGIARLTNYGAYLKRYPPTHEVQIVENTAWSCSHGVGRWRSNCGCNTGGHPSWNQAWRAPLREALDWLRDTLILPFERLSRTLLKDPWKARDEYISVILDRSPRNVEHFLHQHACRPLTPDEKIVVLKLMELQRHAMLMYTSCGWFFDDIAGIETIQVIQYAGRALQLAQELFGDAIEERFLQLLEQAKSNVPDQRDGRHIYERYVKPAIVDLRKVGAHYAMSSLFEHYNDRDQVHCYRVAREDYRLLHAAKSRLALGRVKITSVITQESADISFGVLHLGDHNLSGGVREFMGDAAYANLVESITETFLRADIPGVIRLVDKHFGSDTYSLKLLFRDRQREILDLILDSTLDDVEHSYRQIYENHAPLMRFLSSLGMPIPRGFQIAAEFALNTDLRRALEANMPDLARIASLLKEAAWAKAPLDKAGLSYAFEQTIGRITAQFHNHPEDIAILQTLENVVKLVRTMPLEVDLWKTQNIYYAMLQTVYPEFREEAMQGYEDSRLWVSHFVALGERLGVRVER